MYPLPLVDDILGGLSNCSVFSTLDLKVGYHQVPIAIQDREKTAFITPDGLFQFKRMPFELCNAVPTFRRLMDQDLAGLKWKTCFVFMYDILVPGRDLSLHNERLDAVLKELIKAGLTLNVKKCVFATDEVAHVGYVINEFGLSPNPSKVAAIIQMSRPRTSTQLKSFLGSAGYYRQFVPNFASISRPLENLNKKGADVLHDRNDEHEEAFVTLKKALSEAPVLDRDNGVLELELQIDASGHGLGAVLQIQKEQKRTRTKNGDQSHI